MDGIGVQSHEWKLKRSLPGRKMGRFWCGTVRTITTCSVWVSARTAGRCTRGSSTARDRSASTRSRVPTATSPSSSLSSGRSTTRRPACSATRAPALSGRRRSRCGWRAPCRGLRRSDLCSTSAAFSFASTLASITSSNCLCRLRSKAGLRNDRTSADYWLAWICPFLICT